MKIKNIGNKEIRIAFTPKKGKMIIADLKPGQIIFGEPGSIDNKQIVILKRKGKLEILEEDKPKKVEYYKPYGLMSHKDMLKLTHIETKKTTVILDIDEDDDENNDIDMVLPEIEKSSVKEDENEFSIDDDDDDDDLKNNKSNIKEIANQKEDSQNTILESKNKGGRPKGSKNKPKRGRPKNNKNK